MPDKSLSQRLFFALWPDDVQRRELAHWVEALGLVSLGRPVVAQNLHLTLIFLGQTEPRRQTCYQSVAARIESPGFSLIFDRLSFFRRTNVVWAGANCVPPTVQNLHRQLRDGLVACGYRPESRAFTPHLTLLRKVKSRPRLASPPPFTWSFTQFCLIASRLSSSGASYEVLNRYPLLSR